MKSIQQNTLKICLIILALGFLAACGSSKTSDDGFGSANSSSTTTPSNAVQAICSQDVSNYSDLKVRLMQYKDQYNQTRSDLVRLQFKIAPSAWQTNNLDMLVYRWSSSPDNSLNMDTTPLYYQFEKKVPSGFQLISQNSYQIFNFTEIQQMGAARGISATSPQDFFNTASLLVNLRDSTNAFQVLRVVFRQNGTVVESTDLLIPTFQANPTIYNADTRHSVSLQALHPLKDKAGQNWPDASWDSMAQSFCF
jgi:hypothetical protein